MIDLDIIEREIHDLEARGDTTYSMCERLSWLYVVRDHLRPVTMKPQELYGSEFLETASKRDYASVMRILDEHMDAIKVVYPNEYENVISRIRSL